MGMRSLRFVRMNIPVYMYYQDVRSSIHCVFRMTLAFNSGHQEVTSGYCYGASQDPPPLAVLDRQVTPRGPAMSWRYHLPILRGSSALPLRPALL